MKKVNRKKNRISTELGGKKNSPTDRKEEKNIKKKEKWEGKGFRGTE